MVETFRILSGRRSPCKGVVVEGVVAEYIRPDVNREHTLLASCIACGGDARHIMTQAMLDDSVRGLGRVGSVEGSH